MSATTPSLPDDDADLDDYDAVLEQLDKTIDTLQEKIENGRVRDVDRAEVRVKQYRALAYLVRTKRQVLSDRHQLDDLEERLQELANNGSDGSASTTDTGGWS